MSNENMYLKNYQRLQLIAEKDILSFKEALLYMDVSESFLYKLTAKKAIRFTKPNKGKLFFEKKILNEWMLQNPSEDKNNLEEHVFNHLAKHSK